MKPAGIDWGGVGKFLDIEGGIFLLFVMGLLQELAQVLLLRLRLPWRLYCTRIYRLIHRDLGWGDAQQPKAKACFSKESRREDSLRHRASVLTENSSMRNESSSRYGVSLSSR